ICTPMTSLKTSIKTITYLSDTGCLEIQGASLVRLREVNNVAIITQGCCSCYWWRGCCYSICVNHWPRW
ncbi:hypothetical protein CG420_26945, partial [Shigella sonnei]